MNDWSRNLQPGIWALNFRISEFLLVCKVWKTVGLLSSAGPNVRDELGTSYHQEILSLVKKVTF